jgi:hypothetical protein
MAKPSLDPLLEAGERRLAAWEVEDTASVTALGQLLHRDAAADVAIASRLGALASDESAALLQRLERETADKHVRKAAKRALYRLEQRGVRPPEPPASPPPAALTTAPIEGYISPIDGRGDQLVWLVKPQPGAVAHLFAVINDPEGLREVALNTVTRKALKSIRAELEQQHELRLVEVDWQYADFLIHRAFEWARARGTRMTGDYTGLRAQLTRQPAPSGLAPSVLARVDAADETALAQSAALLEEPELRTWFRDAEQLASALAELASVKDSPLVLNPAQQEERFGAVIMRAIDDVFGPDQRPSWARRVYEMGYYFAVTGRPQRAAQAVAVARALEGSGAAREIPFCAQLVRASLAFFFQRTLQEEQEREQTSLVLTPQQAVARRERR